MLDQAADAASFVSRRTFNKVFGIGFNKTGTTSLATVLRKLGFTMPNQAVQELSTVRALTLGDVRPLIKLVERYDAFQDLPFSQGVCYAQVDALFPQSKFILTVRDPELWVESLIRPFKPILAGRAITHDDILALRDRVGYLDQTYLYEVLQRMLTVVANYKPAADWSRALDRTHYIRLFTQRNDAIIAYFQNRPADLLVIDLRSEADTCKIVEFLDIPAQFATRMPHDNRSP